AAADLAHELDAGPAPAPVPPHVHVGEVRERGSVGYRARESDLLRAAVQPDDARRAFDRAHRDLARAPASPVGLLAEERVQRVDVDPRWVVVELDSTVERAPNRPPPRAPRGAGVRPRRPRRA